MDGDARVFIGIGANLGNRLAHLREGARGLAAHPDIHLTAVSPVYETEAHTLDPGEEAPPYLNAVVALRTSLAPEALLQVSLGLEEAAGRRRSESEQWAPRSLDIDLLVYGREVRRTPGLTLPHPRLGERRFVLQPLVDLSPNLYVPPPFDAAAAALLARCPDPHRVVRTTHTLTSP